MFWPYNVPLAFMAVWAGLLGAYQFQQSKFGTNESQPTFKGGKVTHSFQKLKKTSDGASRFLTCFGSCFCVGSWLKGLF